MSARQLCHAVAAAFALFIYLMLFGNSLTPISYRGYTQICMGNSDDAILYWQNNRHDGISPVLGRDGNVVPCDVSAENEGW